MESKIIELFGKKTRYTINENAEVFNTSTNTILTGWIGKRGYRVVTLSIPELGIGKLVIKKPIHRLVAEAFIPNPKNLPQVNHIDGNKLNNKKSNLEWVTNKENYEHARRTGLIRTGEDLSYSTVDNETVHKICKMICQGKRNIEIIQALGLPTDQHGKGLITRIRTGKAWKDISDKYDFIKMGSLKKVPDEVIHEICKRLEHNYPLKEIFHEIGLTNNFEYHRFKGLVYDIKTRKSHKSISSQYNIM